MSTISSPKEALQLTQRIATNSPASIQLRQTQRRQTLVVIGGRVLFLALFLVAWQIASLWLGALFVSAPLDVLARMRDWTLDGTLWSNTQVTLEETLLGLLLGVTTGIAAGFLLGLLPLLAKILDPFIIGAYSIPKVALAPLFMLWFGFDLQMKVMIAAVMVFFLVFFNTLTGVRNVDQNLIDAVRLMGARRRDLLIKVIIPSATGYVLTGLHLAIPYALIGAIIGEMTSENRGLGYLINNSAGTFDPAGVFAALVILTVIAILLNGAVNALDRYTSRWKAGMHLNSKIIPQ